MEWWYERQPLRILLWMRNDGSHFNRQVLQMKWTGERMSRRLECQEVWGCVSACVWQLSLMKEFCWQSHMCVSICNWYKRIKSYNLARKNQLSPTIMTSDCSFRIKFHEIGSDGPIPKIHPDFAHLISEMKKKNNTASITQKIAHTKSVAIKWLHNVLRTLPHYFLDNLFISIVRRDECWRLLLTRCTMLVCCLRDSLRGRQLYVCHSILYRFQHHRHTSIVYIYVALSKVNVRQTTVRFYFWAMTNIMCACVYVCVVCVTDLCKFFSLSLRKFRNVRYLFLRSDVPKNFISRSVKKLLQRFYEIPLNNWSVLGIQR